MERERNVLLLFARFGIICRMFVYQPEAQQDGYQSRGAGDDQGELMEGERTDDGDFRRYYEQPTSVSSLSSSPLSGGRETLLLMSSRVELHVRFMMGSLGAGLGPSSPPPPPPPPPLGLLFDFFPFGPTLLSSRGRLSSPGKMRAALARARARKLCLDGAWW